ncbi:STAS domain-containing protein [Streptomyces virginiae]|uniref:STAS domain-containing protein n=1 Tax=Streptomyces virginiae TaxID=1961 RepID=UPI00224ECAEF|nr:STAS domain-containing protein [Streptomyces virginiae]MCX5278216.1 STAS domain-containing protein [Streptomyces virginiae]
MMPRPGPAVRIAGIRCSKRRPHTSGITFADSSFLTLLLQAHALTELRIAAPPHQLQRLLAMTGADTVLHLHPTVQADQRRTPAEPRGWLTGEDSIPRAGLRKTSPVRAPTRAARADGTEAGRMAAKLIVYPPDAQGWRRVRYDGTAIGVAHRPSDIRVFLAEAGLENAEDVDLTDPGFVEWRGAGPEEWEPSV